MCDQNWPRSNGLGARICRLHAKESLWSLLAQRLNIRQAPHAGDETREQGGGIVFLQTSDSGSGIFRSLTEMITTRSGHRQRAVPLTHPPSMTISVPVMAEALSDAANATSSLTSSGRLGRPDTAGAGSRDMDSVPVHRLSALRRYRDQS